MRGSVYLKTLRDLRVAIILWSLGVAAIAALNVLLYPTVQQMDGLLAFLDSMPRVFKAMIGDLSALARLDGFLWVKLFEPLPLLLAIFVVSHGAQALAGEIEHRHVDLLLARPVRRRRVVAAKFLALVTGVTVIGVATALAVVVSAAIIGAEGSTRRLVVATLNALPLSWLFAALALIASSLADHPRSAGFVAGAVVVASYVFETARLVSPAFAWWRPVSLFAYQKAGYPLAGDPDLVAVLLLLGLTALLATGAALGWERRDLAA
ncbi:MAG: ABC transporter permease subunit [Candidatus Krumholzibacteriia bacterium]